jgi:hypothetical protein
MYKFLQRIDLSCSFSRFEIFCLKGLITFSISLSIPFLASLLISFITFHPTTPRTVKIPEIIINRKLSVFEE